MIEAKRIQQELLISDEDMFRMILASQFHVTRIGQGMTWIKYWVATGYLGGDSFEGREHQRPIYKDFSVRVVDDTIYYKAGERFTHGKFWIQVERKIVRFVQERRKIDL